MQQHGGKKEREGYVFLAFGIVGLGGRTPWQANFINATSTIFLFAALGNISISNLGRPFILVCI
jgi:hypothetical protein